MRRRILVVDDDARLGASLRRALAYEGYSVDVVTDGSDALVEARDRPPDLVVLDVMLPGGDRRPPGATRSRTQSALCRR